MLCCSAASCSVQNSHLFTVKFKRYINTCCLASREVDGEFDDTWHTPVYGIKMYTYRICSDLWGFCRGQVRSSLSYLHTICGQFTYNYTCLFVLVCLGLELLRSEMTGGIFGTCAAPFKHFVFCHFHILTVCFFPCYLVCF